MAETPADFPKYAFLLLTFIVGAAVPLVRIYLENTLFEIYSLLLFQQFSYGLFIRHDEIVQPSCRRPLSSLFGSDRKD